MSPERTRVDHGVLGAPVPSLPGPRLTVGIMDGRREVSGTLNGGFSVFGPGNLSGGFRAHTSDGMIVLADRDGREIARAPLVRLVGQGDATFTLSHVTIGNRFHWERAEDQTFRGDLVLKPRMDGSITVINEIAVEEYLESVISSEMKGSAPMEFLKAHAILSRSWLLSALARRKKGEETKVIIPAGGSGPGEVTRWYEREDHDLFDVCADDHCQRYQGITKIIPGKAAESVVETCGTVLTYGGEICDARYSKACGGLTETFETAWSDTQVPYLVSISDAPIRHCPVTTEEEAARWILSKPQAYCNTEDACILEDILPDFDRETTAFFRWKVEYGREQLEGIIREKSGIDLGTLQEITPLLRGPSGRIFRLRITGSKESVVVGKELEIRRWLSASHLLSSAFMVTTERGPGGEVRGFTFHGAGWGHGVGLCQIGAAVMATRGFEAEDILGHYFPGAEINKIY